MDQWTDKQMDRGTNITRGGRTNKWIDGWRKGQTVGKMARQIEKWTDRRTETEGQKDNVSSGQRNRPMNKKTNGQRNGHMEKFNINTGGKV